MSGKIKTTKIRKPKKSVTKIDQAPQPSHLGMIIGLLIIALTIILICLYIWSRMLATEPITPPATTQRPTAEENNEPESTKAEAEAGIIEVLSTSDELGPIEADLSATNFESLAAELNAIEAEFNSAVR